MPDMQNKRDNGYESTLLMRKMDGRRSTVIEQYAPMLPESQGLRAKFMGQMLEARPLIAILNVGGFASDMTNARGGLPDEWEVFSPEPERHVDQSDQHRHLHQRPDHRREGLA